MRRLHQDLVRVVGLPDVQARFAELAMDPDIDAAPGPDGLIGTVDDETACTARCPATFGEYWILVHLLAPRFDTRGNPLPSAALWA